jgi:hypothetical protein
VVLHSRTVHTAAGYLLQAFKFDVNLLFNERKFPRWNSPLGSGEKNYIRIIKPGSKPTVLNDGAFEVNQWSQLLTEIILKYI